MKRQPPADPVKVAKQKRLDRQIDPSLPLRARLERLRPRVTSGPPTSAPVNVVVPAIEGSPNTGSVLRLVFPGTWAPTAETYAFQWQLDGSDILDETGLEYTVDALDATLDITCVVTATNVVGSNSASSNAITAVNP